jgi:hypothetical protein
MRSLVMSDVETDTEWAHLLGRAMAGKLKGKVLTPLVTDMVTWATWREQFPQTTLLNLPPTSQNYTREFYRDPNRFVFGFVIGSQAWALPMQKMKQHPVHRFQVEGQSLLATFVDEGAVTHLFDATVDGMPLDFTAIDQTTMKDQQTGSVWKIVSGQAISGPLQGTLLKQHVGIMSFRRAWMNFHPDSDDVPFGE